MKKKLAIFAVTACAIWAIVTALIPGLRFAFELLTRQYTGMRFEPHFMEAHQRAVTSFVKSKGFGSSRLRHKSLWNERNIIIDGLQCYPQRIQLLGLTQEYGPRYFDDSLPPKKESLKTAAHRELSIEEAEAVERLLEETSQFERIAALESDTEHGTFRVLALIKAQADCLKCHDISIGQPLGALAYTLIPNTSTLKPISESSTDAASAVDGNDGHE